MVGGPSAEPSDFAPPTGAFLVAYEDDRAIACGGLKTVDLGVAEVKRMYVVPEARRRGVGRALLAALEAQARSMGFARVRLDCQRHNWPLYRAAGYVEIGDYNENPFADHWAEKHPGAGHHVEAATASGPCSAAAGSIHMTCQPWPSRS